MPNIVDTCWHLPDFMKYKHLLGRQDLNQADVTRTGCPSMLPIASTPVVGVTLGRLVWEVDRT